MSAPEENGFENLPELPGVTHRRVQLRELRMHVAEAGEGPPLVLLHGWPQHWWSHRHLIPQLATRYRVLAPDLRGLGWSDAPPGDYAKSTFADDVLELLDHEGIEQAFVIGHDWGGYAAFLLALEHPQRVRRMIALDIPPPWPGRPRPRQVALPLLVSYQVLLATPLGRRMLMSGPGLVRAIIRLATGPLYQWNEQDLELYAQRLREPARAQASSAIYRTFLTRELPASLRRGDRSAELSVPTLLLMGQNSGIDRILTPQSSGMLEVRRVAGAGHFLAEEAPAEVLAAAAEWFGDAAGG
ncbi:MAG TPA: alpha/beta hydrolase [Solirubrobacteraceae bacterium]|jgi:pimeloyl-ACP methyl ester carboxylesterase